MFSHYTFLHLEPGSGNEGSNSTNTNSELNYNGPGKTIQILCSTKHILNKIFAIQIIAKLCKIFFLIKICKINFLITSPSDVRDRSDRKGVKYFKVVKVVKGGKEVKGVEWVKIKRFIGFNGLRSWQVNDLLKISWRSGEEL